MSDQGMTTNIKLNKQEAEFVAKQRKGVRVEAAEWIRSRNKPDHPENWRYMRVRMDDKSTYRLRDAFVQKHDLLWIGIDK